MTQQRLHDVLASAFVAEGIDAHFALLGDANMHWATVMAEQHGVRTIHARHEHCACAMATAYAHVTGRIAVASVTHGPGFTQNMTALATAARGEIPLIVFAGEVPTTAVWTLQDIDQAPLARAVGAEYIRIQSLDHALDRVREAFCIARMERRPVVLGVPSNLQQALFPNPPAYVPSHVIMPKEQPGAPDPQAVGTIADMIAAAKRPIVLAGRGIVLSQAKQEILELAERGGALLATTLAARGLFDDQAFAVGIAGGWSSDVAVELFAEADLVIAVGASLTGHTTQAGRLYPKARVIQIDTHPRALRHSRQVADHHLRADAKLAAAAIGSELARRGVTQTGYRTPDVARRIENAVNVSDEPIAPGTIDPRLAIQAINRVVPKDWFVVGGSGHCAYFAGTNMPGRPPELYSSIRDFGAIGSNIAHAIGVAVARNDSKVLLIDGDGSLLMHIQELETIARHGLKMLIVALNDGAYGSEVHKLRADGFSDAQVQFGRPDFASIAQGFNLRGAAVSDLAQLEVLFDRHMEGNQAEIWDIPISGDVLSPPFRREHERHKEK
jgi:thiamine pyrophosphate-dependent acetolactate synthase large subunit-like protein